MKNHIVIKLLLIAILMKTVKIVDFATRPSVTRLKK